MSCVRSASPASLQIAAALVGIASTLTSAAHGQAPASFAGRATDVEGRPIRKAEVRLVSDPTPDMNSRAWRYTVIGDSLGKFSQEGIAPGAYLVMLFTDVKGTDVLKRVMLSPGGTAEMNFGPGRKEPMELAGTSTPLSTDGRRRTSVQTR